MIVAIRDHQCKSHGIRDALRMTGCNPVPVGKPADVLLIDADLDCNDYRKWIHAYEDKGARIVLYPHGGQPMCVWDGIVEPYPVDACFVIAEGHKDVMETYGYPYPINVIGWSMCRQKPFQPSPETPRVLFAPLHPLGNGYLREDHKQANADAYRMLLDWGWPLTVRLAGTFEQNGLWKVDDVSYEATWLDLSIDAFDVLDDHDLIVARDTFLSLAVARGKPALAFGQMPVTNDPASADVPLVVAAHWDLYGDMMRYPYDLSTTDPSVAMTCEAIEWRNRFIGQQIDPASLIEIIRLVHEAEVTV